MQQSTLSNQVEAVLSDCKDKLRAIAFSAAAEVAKVRADVTADVEVLVADGRKAVVNAEKSVLSLEGVYANKVADLEAVLAGLHNLLGAPAPAPVVETPAPKPAAPAAPATDSKSAS